MCKLKLLLVLLSCLVIVTCARKPDVVIVGCCTNAKISFRDEAGNVTIVPRYYLTINGEDYKVTGLIYSWAEIIVPRVVMLKYWFDDDGVGWDVEASQHGDCTE